MTKLTIRWVLFLAGLALIGVGIASFQSMSTVNQIGGWIPVVGKEAVDMGYMFSAGYIVVGLVMVYLSFSKVFRD